MRIDMIDREKLEAVLDKVRPAIQADGGDVELINIREDNVVEVRLKGACNGCPMATLTLKAGIERIVKEEIPEVVEVISV
jgi:Fe-S cluster biogenesis protein NfuA